MVVVGALAAAAFAGDDDPVAPLPTPKVLEAGKAAYDQVCAACHGPNGDGAGPVAFALKPPPRNFRKDAFKAGDSVRQVFHTVTYGLPDSKMIGYPQLDATTRWGLAYIVVSFRPKT